MPSGPFRVRHYGSFPDAPRIGPRAKHRLVNGYREGLYGCAREQDTPQPTYRIHWTLAVTDVAALWRSALDRGLQAPGMDAAALIDVLGPREDPAV
eukprot:gene38633-46771_t